MAGLAASVLSTASEDSGYQAPCSHSGVTMPAVLTESVGIGIGGGRRIEADLVVPGRALGLVVFAHGSGSSRFSSRNRAVAESLHARQLGTVLLDLLTGDEGSVDVYTAEYRFDIERLGSRVVIATDWVQ